MYINRRDDLAAFRPDENNMFQKQYLSISLRDTNYNTGRREPFLMICDGNTHFSVNLYQGETYIGNLKIAFVLRPFRLSVYEARPRQTRTAEGAADLLQ